MASSWSTSGSAAAAMTFGECLLRSLGCDALVVSKESILLKPIRFTLVPSLSPPPPLLQLQDQDLVQGRAYVSGFKPMTPRHI